jgi:hypothetical protein
LVMALVDRGGDPNAKDKDNMSPLHYASYNQFGRLEVVKFLIDIGSDPTAIDEDGNTPLSIASKMLYHSEMVNMLSMYTGATPQHRLIWAATLMEHLIVYHEFYGTQVVIDLFEFLGS